MAASADPEVPDAVGPFEIRPIVELQSSNVELDGRRADSSSTPPTSFG